MGPSPVPPSHSAPCGGQGMLIIIIYEFNSLFLSFSKQLAQSLKTIAKMQHLERVIIKIQRHCPWIVKMMTTLLALKMDSEKS